MNKIFIEAKDKKTPEYHFLRAITGAFFADKEVAFICMDGIGNLFGEVIVNQISLAQDAGEQVIVLADADTEAKGYGYEKREEEISLGGVTHNLFFPYFLYPNNGEDGDVETLMERAARRDLHATFFDCFEDYEKCVSGVKDGSRQPLYNVPNLKGKLHTYMNAQQLTNKQRKGLGSGDWLFENTNYWNLHAEALRPLLDFLAMHLQ